MPGFDVGVFAIFPILFTIVFLFVMGVILYTIFRTVSMERKNDRSPKLTVNAKVVGKRMDYHRHAGTRSHGPGFTRYFVTFQVDSGDRMELSVQGPDYGLMVEGDYGKVSFQGTRFLSFERTLMPHDV